MRVNRQGLAKATTVLLLGNIVSSLLGFVRETVIASQFGATATTDAYLVAFIVPGAVISLVASAMPTAFIPVFTEYRVKYGEEESWRIASTLINLLLIALSLVAIANFALARFYVPLMGPGLAPWAKELAVYLTRLMSPVIILTGIAGLSTSILNAYRQFTYPAFALSLYNIGIIGGALLLSRSFGIAGLAIGMMAGALGQLIVQSIPLRGERHRYMASLKLVRHPAVRKVTLLILPLTIGSAAHNIGLVVNRSLASGLAEGSIAALNFASLVTQLPLTVFTLAFATAIYPTLSQHMAEGNLDGLMDTFSEGLRTLLLIIIPITVGLIAFSRPIVRLLFEHGEFTREATSLTAITLSYLSLGLLALAGLALVFRVYSSMQDTFTPVMIGVVSIGINIVFSVVLVRFYGLAGIALANSIAANINFVLLGYMLRQKLGRLDGKRIGLSVAKVGFASLVTVGICLAVFNHVASQATSVTLSRQFFQLGGVTLLGTIMYAFFVRALRLEELVKLRNALALRRSAAQTHSGKTRY